MAEEELYAEEVEGGEEGYEEDEMAGEEEFGAEGDADVQNEVRGMRAQPSVRVSGPSRAATPKASGCGSIV